MSVVVPFCPSITTTAVLLNIQRLAGELVYDNRRFSALLSEACSLTDFWMDLTEDPDWMHKADTLSQFDKRLRLFREDTRLLQEEIETVRAQRSAATGDFTRLLRTGS